jgi:ribosomal protein S18 acetylase RimI-like enzyme
VTAAIVRRATAGDVEALGIIAPAAYAERYSYLWDNPEAYAEQLRTFGSRAFEASLARPEARVWIGETAGTIVGFLSMIVGSVDPVQYRRGGAEIPRIYVIAPAQRMGLGRLLLDAAIGQAETEGLSHLWLDVMASAAAARRAYAKWGFRGDWRLPIWQAGQAWPVGAGRFNEGTSKSLIECDQQVTPSLPL